ncbi:MAG TPA: hypothetical protein VEY08_02675, partial [Chloroflexia bacterium]|nr:hypothetical protein [Chloroflexia bacterium]
MSNKTKRVKEIETHSTNGSHDGEGREKAIPAIKARVGSRRIEAAKDTQELSTVGNGHNGN